MAEYGAVRVYDKSGKYLGTARWRRPSEELTDKERRQREEEFNLRVFGINVSDNPIENPLDSCTAYNEELSDELIADINSKLDKKNN